MMSKFNISRLALVVFLVSTQLLKAQPYNVNNVSNNVLQFGASGQTVSNYPSSSTGKVAGDIVVFSNVATISGQSIDAVMETKSLSSGTTFSNYDVTSGTGNSVDFFSPQFSFSNQGDYAVFKVSFITNGSFSFNSSNNTWTGTAAVLQNININAYDLDGNGMGTSSTGNGQFIEFQSIKNYLLGSSSVLVSSYNNATHLTRFTSTVTTNNSNVTDDDYRVKVVHKDASSLEFTVGSNETGGAYFYLDFSVGPNWTNTPVTCNAQIARNPNTFELCPSDTIILTGTGTPNSTSPWVSSSTSVATVSTAGVVSGVSAGTVGITYTFYC
jgi:hypothetical protein